MVTLAPTLRSPLIFVSLLRPTSHLSLPFCTVMLVGVISSTGPVTWYFRESAALRELAARSAVPHIIPNQYCFDLDQKSSLSFVLAHRLRHLPESVIL